MKFDPSKQDIELGILDAYPDVEKDILMVVKDGLEYVVPCIQSVYACTDKFKLYIWDNASSQETADYLQSLKKLGANVTRSEKNEGFIIPNNRLIEKGKSPYVILLNSDCCVKPGWDRGLTGMLQLASRFGITGYGGGIVNEKFIGVDFGYGHDIDFIMGYCLALRRSTYEDIGLFDEKNLSFAYGEDSDLCMRAREKGLKIYALCLNMIWHKGGATSSNLFDEIKPHFIANHDYLCKRWANYLKIKFKEHYQAK